MIEPPMVRVPGGEFLMGDDTGRDNERPAHRVWVDPFEMAAVTVTNRMYAAFLAATGHPSPGAWGDPLFSDPDQPVVAVSWFEAEAYCGWLSRESGAAYRLPTEAEWERAARGGFEGGKYPWGDQFPPARIHYERGWDTDRPERVGRFEPNAFGLYNMADNVHEWCADWYQADYYSGSPPRNPGGPASGVRRASRNGSWRHQVKICPCAARSSIEPHRRYTDYGFRIARTPGA
jgi:formylglycine-generating enzyme required for sulfatase activity